MNKKIIITGATGQDGSYMVDFLLKNTDFEIIGAVRRTSQIIDKNLKHNLNNKNFRLIQFDLTDVHSVTNTIKNEQPDYFINFGAQTFVADSWVNPVSHFTTNAMAILHILEAIKNYAPKCKLYSSGTSEQFGDVDYSPQDINHPMKARSPYGASKIAAHQLIKVYRESYNLYAIHSILFNHESERRQDYFVTRKITKGVARIYHAIKNNEPFTPIELGNLDARRDWSHAEDFIDGVWKMLNQEIPKDYVLSSNETHTIKEFVNLAFVYADIPCAWHGEGEHKELSIQSNILSLGEAQSSVLVKINPKFYRPAEVELLLGNSDLARRELGWRPKVSFDKLVEKMVKFDIDNFQKSV